MIALSAATITATTSAPPKPSMSTPGRIAAATISAIPAPSHETIRGNSFQLGFSARQAVDWP